MCNAHIESKKTRCGGWLCQVSMVAIESHIKALEDDMQSFEDKVLNS